jgi:hypothetical protein
VIDLNLALKPLKERSRRRINAEVSDTDRVALVRGLDQSGRARLGELENSRTVARIHAKEPLISRHYTLVLDGHLKSSRNDRKISASATAVSDQDLDRFRKSWAEAIMSNPSSTLGNNSIRMFHSRHATAEALDQPRPDSRHFHHATSR